MFTLDMVFLLAEVSRIVLHKENDFLKKAIITTGQTIKRVLFEA